jgi:hypothetical protein
LGSVRRGIGNEVYASLGEGHAAEEAFRGKPSAATSAVEGDRLFSVLRTGRIELADAAPHRGKPKAIGFDEEE